MCNEPDANGLNNMFVVNASIFKAVEITDFNGTISEF